jgi:hypothetical protein
VTGVELGGLFEVELLARTVAQECGSFEVLFPRVARSRHARCLRRILFRRQSLLARSQATLHFAVDAAGMIGRGFEVLLAAAQLKQIQQLRFELIGEGAREKGRRRRFARR